MNDKTITLTDPKFVIDNLMEEYSNISSAVDTLHTVDTFLRDISEHFFNRYDESMLDDDGKVSPDILRVVWHDTQKFRVYIDTAIENTTKLSQFLAVSLELNEIVFKAIADDANENKAEDVKGGDKRKVSPELLELDSVLGDIGIKHEYIQSLTDHVCDDFFDAYSRELPTHETQLLIWNSFQKNAHFLEIANSYIHALKEDIKEAEKLVSELWNK